MDGIVATAEIEDEETSHDPAFTPGVEKRTRHIYERVKHAINEAEWREFAPLVDEVIRLKKERNAIILAHNYQTRDIFHCVADVVGDSLYLARKGAEVEADVIVMGGVHFMAETAKIMNPERTVLIPDPEAGCSLADAITPQDVRDLRKQYPGVPIVTYVNTTAAVKAECDITCTSANAKKVVESLGVPRVIMVPDKFLARNTDAETDVEIIEFDGVCEVHENFSANQVHQLRKAHPGISVLAHPECPREVIEVSDFSGSTSGMANWVDDHPEARQVAMITECSMSANVAMLHPEVDFVRSCGFCPYMQKITLANIAKALRTNTHEVTLPADLIERARKPIEAMLRIS